jgi:hypothetical protein
MRTLRLKENGTDKIVKFEHFNTDHGVSILIGTPDNLHGIVLSPRQMRAIIAWGHDYLNQRNAQEDPDVGAVRRGIDIA